MTIDTETFEVLVSGASFVKGYGLEYTSDDPKLWVNQLVQSTFKSAKVNNVAMVGRSNEWIFLEAMSNLIKKNYDLLIVGWAPIPRFNFHVGLELYDVMTKLDASRDYHLNNYKTVYGKDLVKIKNGLLKIHNDHWDLVKLIQYVNALIEVQVKCRKKKIVFFNCHMDVPQDFFVKKDIQLPSDLTEYEKNLLDVDARDDSEIFALYNMIHEQYDNYGTIHPELWANLYKSFVSMKIDEAPHAPQHPGYLSQDIFVKTLLPQFQEIVLN
jgi:hypothetical protein